MYLGFICESCTDHYFTRLGREPCPSLPFLPVPFRSPRPLPVPPCPPLPRPVGWRDFRYCSQQSFMSSSGKTALILSVSPVIHWVDVFLVRSQSSIADRSYVCPWMVLTGSLKNSSVIGQHRSMGPCADVDDSLSLGMGFALDRRALKLRRGRHHLQALSDRFGYCVLVVDPCRGWGRRTFRKKLDWLGLTERVSVRSAAMCGCLCS